MSEQKQIITKLFKQKIISKHDKIQIKKIIHNLSKNHKCGQKVLFEIGLEQAEVVSNLLKNNDFKLIHIKDDIAGIPRCIAAEKI